MVDSRLKNDPPSLFHCYIEYDGPNNECKDPKIVLQYPDEFSEKEIILKQAPGFCYPCEIERYKPPFKFDGVEYSTFVLTDLESKFRFGFCRYPAKSKRCLCIISYLPWFKTFYSVLDRISQLPNGDTNDRGKVIFEFLEIFNKQLIPDPGSQILMKFKEKAYSFVAPDTTKLPHIPDNRNLTKYYSKIAPENMVHLFISMLFERRIIITSEKLSVLTAVIHGSVSLLYPMQWQHIYVPILPPHLTDYCCAPMPFLLGIHSSMMDKVRQLPMNEVVILNADTNEMELPDDELESSFPNSVMHKLVKRLSRTEKASQDYVSRLFLEALADLIGGYRDAIKFENSAEGGKVVFDEELFLNSRKPQRKGFLESMLALQSFRQLIAGRLDMINDGVGFVDIFEKAIIKRNQDAASETRLDTFKDKMKTSKDKMKKGGGALKKSMEGKYSHLKGIASEIEVKEEVKDFKKKLTEKMKKRKKERRRRQDQVDHATTVKRNNSLPLNNSSKVNTMQRHQTVSDRHSLYASLPKKDGITKPGKTPPPRPPRPNNTHLSPGGVNNGDLRSVELPRRTLELASSSVMPSSNSEGNIADLLDLNSFSASSSSTLSSFSSNSLARSLDSIDSSGGLLNPAFKDPIPESHHENNDDNDGSEHLIFEKNTESSPKLLAASSLKRGVPVKRQNTPPSRPPQMKTAPQRPPLPARPDKAENRRLSSSHNDAFIEPSHCDNDDATKSEELCRRSIVLPNSPFYTPSQDLLGLDHSLFHEIGSSLSDDTRSILTLGSSVSDTKTTNLDQFTDNPFAPPNSQKMSPTNPFASQGTITENRKMDLVFDDSDNTQQGLHRSPVLTRATSIPMRNSTTTGSSVDRAGAAAVNSASSEFDPFASCFEDAKRDFRLTDKSKQLMRQKTHIFRTASLRIQRPAITTGLKRLSSNTFGNNDKDNDKGIEQSAFRMRRYSFFYEGEI